MFDIMFYKYKMSEQGVRNRQRKKNNSNEYTTINIIFYNTITIILNGSFNEMKIKQ